MEYPKGHISRSVYAIFKILNVADIATNFLEGLLPNLGLAIWTTTPWTIPKNVVVAVTGQLLYAVIQVRTKSSIDTTTEGVKKPIFESRQHIVFATNLVSCSASCVFSLYLVYFDLRDT